MSDYVSLFDPIPWKGVVNSIIQTFIIYWLVLLGLKLAGKRVFGEMGPQDLVILLLVAEACDLGLSDETAGFWGTMASVLTILIMGGIIERIKPLRNALDDKPVVLYENGRHDRKAMEKNLVEEGDLEQAARQYGMESHHDFQRMTLENDGSISGIIKPEFRFVSQAARTKQV